MSLRDSKFLFQFQRPAKQTGIENFDPNLSGESKQDDFKRSTSQMD